MEGVITETGWSQQERLVLFIIQMRREALKPEEVRV